MSTENKSRERRRVTEADRKDTGKVADVVEVDPNPELEELRTAVAVLSREKLELEREISGWRTRCVSLNLIIESIQASETPDNVVPLPDVSSDGEN